MTWIKSDSELSRSRKFFDLVSRLNVSPAKAFWNLHHLWYWCSDQFPDGVMKDVSDLAIAHSAQWSDDPKTFVEALVISGFIDREPGQLRLHDWTQWASEPVKKKGGRQTDATRTPNGGAPHTSLSSVVLSYPVSGEPNTYELREDILLRLKELYPGVDVLLECKKALFWVEKNPIRKKTSRGMPKFLASWMERQQNRGGSNGRQFGNESTNTRSPSEKHYVPGKYADVSK